MTCKDYCICDLHTCIHSDDSHDGFHDGIVELLLALSFLVLKNQSFDVTMKIYLLTGLIHKNKMMNITD